MLKGGPGIHGDFLPFLVGLRALSWEPGCLGVVVVGDNDQQGWRAAVWPRGGLLAYPISLYLHWLLLKPRYVILEAEG